MPWPNERDGFNILKSDAYEEACACLSEEEQEALNRKLEYLKNNPQHPSLNTKQLHPSAKTLKRLRGDGVDRVYEFYINRKQWRCLLYILEGEKIIWLVGIMDHQEIKNLLK